MDPIVRVEDGELRGMHEENVHGGKYYSFRGIPYARPPVGPLRFKDPQPVQPWKGVKDATEFPGPCAQCDSITRTIMGHDDCLYLNVFTPSLDRNSKKAVMFWVHGGTFRYGSADDIVYGADYLVRKDVVLVTVNYRLGALGFLNVPDTIATGNQGLKDQVMALRWVRKNISLFGGDPKNVTLFGESSGGASVHFLALSPKSKGLFHKIICQSGCAANPWSLALDDQREVCIKFAAELGYKSNDLKACIEFLQTVEPHTLIEAQEKLIEARHDNKFMSPFGPTIDKTNADPFFTDDLERLLDRGVDVPFLIGYTDDEGAFFMRRKVSVKIPRYNEEFYKTINNRFDKFIHPRELKWMAERGITVEDVKRTYFGNEVITRKNLKGYMDFLADMLFIRGTFDFLDVQMEKSDKPMYLYEFSYSDGFSIVRPLLSKELQNGATHSDELPFLFYMKFIKQLGQEAPKPGSDDYRVVQYITELWTNFAKTGNPTPAVTDTLPVIWKPVKKGDAYEFLDIGGTLRVRSHKKGVQRWDWRSQTSKL